MAKKKRVSGRKSEPEAELKPAEPTTIAGLAAAIGVAERTCAGWLRRGCPKGPIAEVEKWRAANLTARSVDVDLNPLTRLKKRKLRVDIRGKEIKNAKDEELMMLRADAERVLADLCIAIKNELEKLPDAIEMEIPRQLRSSLKRTIAHRINQTLSRMATWTI